MSYIRREESLETMVARAIGEGCNFAGSYARTGLSCQSRRKKGPDRGVKLVN